MTFLYILYNDTNKGVIELYLCFISQNNEYRTISDPYQVKWTKLKSDLL